MMGGSRTGFAVLRWVLVAALVAAAVGSGLLLRSTLALRYERDVSRMVFNDNLQVLEIERRRLGLATDSLAQQLAAQPVPPRDEPYVVVSIEDHRLWYRQGDSVLFSAPVATGSGRILERSGSSAHWRFETPRGRLTVVAKDTAPQWVAPDWYYVELAQERGLGIRKLNRGERIPTGDGGYLTVERSDVVRYAPDGSVMAAPEGEGHELVVGGNLIIPPFGTNQRKFAGVLGPYRLSLGDGYAIHGTNKPATIGRSVSHGCIRLRNTDIERLFGLVEEGTQVFVY